MLLKYLPSTVSLCREVSTTEEQSRQDSQESVQSSVSKYLNCFV